MPRLLLTVTLTRPEVVAGEGVGVQVVLENQGPGPAEVPDPDETSQFEFVLKPPGPGDPPLVLSAYHADLTRYGDPLPDMPVEMVEVAPGGQVVYEQDLANFAVEPIRPGRYMLSVVLGEGPEHVRSAPVPLNVVPPQVRALATCVNLYDQSLLLAFAHEEAGGSDIIFQWKSEPESPEDGVAYRRLTFKVPPAIEGVAHSISLAEEPIPRWFAWLQQGLLGAGLAEAQTLLGKVDPISPGLNSVHLYPQGWQASPGVAEFAAIGTGPQEEVSLALAIFDAEVGWTGRIHTVPLEATRIPRYWAVRFRKDENPRRLDVVTAQEGQEKVRLLRQTVSPEARSADPPVVLIERKEPLVNLGLYPVAGAEPGVVDALFGPAGDPPQMLFLRLPLDGGTPIAEFPLSIPLDAKKQPPSNWALTPTPMSEPVVIAKFGRRLLAWRPSADARWFDLAMGASQADHLHLEVIGDTVWAIWADVAKGIQYKVVP
jgi:hypothetical protein